MPNGVVGGHQMPLYDTDPSANRPRHPTQSFVRLHSPGVYFGMPMDEYLDDPALGSSALVDLATNPATYWWGSWMNPRRPPRAETAAQMRGTAVHALVFYGEAYFDAAYMRGPDHSPDMSPPEKSALTKRYNEIAKKKGLACLPAVTYDAVAIAGAMIAKNPELASALVGGLNEVSIFWIDPTNDCRKKARIDVLKPRGVGDLKSLANKFEKPFPKACIEAISNYRYDVQACHYLAARSMIPRLVADGCVYGAHARDLLASVAAEKSFAWQWVFWQSEGPPLTFSKILSPANPLLEISAGTIAKAEQNFVDYYTRFGQEMWLLVEKPSELYVDELPNWFARD